MKLFNCQKCGKKSDIIFVMLSAKLPCVGMKFCEKCVRWFLKEVKK